MGRSSVIVIGAGAFGGWTALNLRRRGHTVTLLDAWGAGHSRASSGGETRVIRCAYADPIHVPMAARALQLWREKEQRQQQHFFDPIGVLFMAQQQGLGFLDAAGKNLAEVGVNHEHWEAADIRRRYPQINPGGIERALFEPDSGVLHARRACATVAAALVREGGEYRVADVRPGRIENGRLRSIQLSNGDGLVADEDVFACGPWLAKLFPEQLSPALRTTRQEVVFLGTPAGDCRFEAEQFPAWADFGERVHYGIPGNERRGFKLAEDVHGPTFDPDAMDRIVDPETLARLRSYLQLRFPALAAAPVVESRVCQYTVSSDDRFLIDRHPEAGNLLWLGGGSGHGFKHGPAVGEYVAQLIGAGNTPEPEFAWRRK